MLVIDNVFDIFLLFTLFTDFYFTFYLELILFEANLGPKTIPLSDEWLIKF